MATGDFDGDGKRDVAISTFESMETGFGNNEGRGHVYVYEYDSGWSSPITVPHPSGTPNVCVFFGWDLEAADVDGDGKDELIVTEPGGDGAGAQSYGAVYIFDYDDTSGPTFVLKHKFQSHASYGGQLGDNFGWSVALADFNGDGDLDLIVGARYWSQCEGCIYVQNQGWVEDWTGAVYIFDHDGWETSTDWRNVNEAELVIRGEPSWVPGTAVEQTRGYFGQSVASVGDLNGDGYDDFIVSAPRRTSTNYTGGCTGQNFNWSYDGNPPWTSESLEDDCRVGTVYLFAGASTYPEEDQEAYDYAKIIFTGENAEDKLGQSLASQGDLNGDGVNDIVIASLLHDVEGNPTRTDVGRVYVFLMPNYSAGWPSGDPYVWEAANANIIIDGPTGDDYVLFGYAMACNGNTNKGTDSRADFLIGAPRGNSCAYTPPQLRNDRGFAYLFRYSGSMAVGENGGHETWTASSAFRYYQILCDENPYDNEAPYLGRSVIFIGDINNDQDYNDEIMFGAPGWDTTNYGNGSANDLGGVYVIPF